MSLERNKSLVRVGKSYPSPQNALNRSGGKKDPVKIISGIIRQQRTMYAKEIAHWKAARLIALDPINPRFKELMDLYNDIGLDAFLSGITGKRTLRISNKPFSIVDPSGEEIEDATALLRRRWFKTYIKKAMESIWYGYSFLYLYEFDAMSQEFKTIKLIPRDHCRPTDCHVLPDPYVSKGYPVNEPPFSQYVSIINPDEDSLGLYDKAAPLFILKKHSWSSWDQFEEMFGIPVRVAKTASQDKTVQAEIKKWLEDMGSAAYGLFPEGTDLEIKQSTATDSFQVFNEKRKAANEELEILVMGITNAAQEGGTYGKQKSLSEEQDEVMEDDADFITTEVNDYLLPQLRANGYAIPEDGSFKFDAKDNTSPIDKAKLFHQVKKLGYELDQDQVQKDTGVIITGKSDISDPKAAEINNVKEVKNILNSLYNLGPKDV